MATQLNSAPANTLEKSKALLQDIQDIQARFESKVRAEDIEELFQLVTAESKTLHLQNHKALLNRLNGLKVATEKANQVLEAKDHDEQAYHQAVANLAGAIKKIKDFAPNFNEIVIEPNSLIAETKQENERLSALDFSAFTKAVENLNNQLVNTEDKDDILAEVPEEVERLVSDIRERAATSIEKGENEIKSLEEADRRELEAAKEPGQALRQVLVYLGGLKSANFMQTPPQEAETEETPDAVAAEVADEAAEIVAADAEEQGESKEDQSNAVSLAEITEGPKFNFVPDAVPVEERVQSGADAVAALELVPTEEPQDEDAPLDLETLVGEAGVDAPADLDEAQVLTGEAAVDFLVPAVASKSVAETPETAVPVRLSDEPFGPPAPSAAPAMAFSMEAEGLVPVESADTEEAVSEQAVGEEGEDDEPVAAESGPERVANPATVEMIDNVIEALKKDDFTVALDSETDLVADLELDQKGYAYVAMNPSRTLMLYQDSEGVLHLSHAPANGESPDWIDVPKGTLNGKTFAALVDIFGLIPKSSGLLSKLGFNKKPKQQRQVPRLLSASGFNISFKLSVEDDVYQQPEELEFLASQIANATDGDDLGAKLLTPDGKISDKAGIHYQGFGNTFLLSTSR